MLGFAGYGVYLAYVLCIASALLCVLYGWLKWNEAEGDEAKEISEEVKWEKEDDKVADSL